MKKLVMMAAIALATSGAYAGDFGVDAGHNGNTGADSAGITFGQQVGIYGVEGTLDRSTAKNSANTTLGLLGSVDVLKFSTATVAVEAGGEFVSPVVGSNGYLGIAGVRLTMPLNKNVSMVTGYDYQDGQARVNKFSGNEVKVGLKYSF